MREPFIELFWLPYFFQKAGNSRMWNMHFCKKPPNRCGSICFDWSSQLVVFNIESPTTTPVIFKDLVPIADFLNSHSAVCSPAVPGPDALVVLPAVSVAFSASLNWKKEIVQIDCFSMLFEIPRKVEQILINKIGRNNRKRTQRFELTYSTSRV